MRESWQSIDGTTVRTREADTDPERAQLRHEATVLGLARHPAVVEVVSTDEQGDHLVTRVSACVTLDDGPSPGSPDWLRVLAGAAQTVADLHALGLVHGGLGGERLWIDRRGHAVLDGFDHAGLAGERHDGGPALRPSSDVAALAALAGLGWPSAHEAASTGRGGRAHRRRSTGPGPELAAILAGAQAGSWAPARRLAAALDAELARTVETAAALDPAVTVESAVEPDPDPFARLRPTDAPTSPRRSRRPPVPAVVLAMLGVVALGWGASRVAAHPSRSTLAPSPAPVVSIAGTSYRIGRSDDQVVVGSWGCGGTRAVVLRPGTGEVFAFDGWARAGHDLVARLVARVTRGSRLVPTHQSSGCDGLSATTPGGAHIDLARAVTR